MPILNLFFFFPFTQSAILSYIEFLYTHTFVLRLYMVLLWFICLNHSAPIQYCFNYCSWEREILLPFFSFWESFQTILGIWNFYLNFIICLPDETTHTHTHTLFCPLCQNLKFKLQVIYLWAQYDVFIHSSLPKCCNTWISTFCP